MTRFFAHSCEPMRLARWNKLQFYFFTQNAQNSRKPYGIEMLLYEGKRKGARSTCATVRMASTNNVCALPRIPRILRATFLPDSNIFYSSTDLAHESEPMRFARCLHVSRVSQVFQNQIYTILNDTRWSSWFAGVKLARWNKLQFYFFTRNTQNSRKPCGIEMQLWRNTQRRTLHLRHRPDGKHKQSVCASANSAHSACDIFTRQQFLLFVHESCSRCEPMRFELRDGRDRSPCRPGVN